MAKFIKSWLALKVAGIEQHKFNAYANSGDYPCAPETGGTGKTRLFSVDVDAPVACLFGDLIQEYTVRHAGRIAGRVKRAMEDNPTADQLTILTLENGFVSVHPTSDLDLSTGFVSGQFLRTAMIVDVRNYRERVRRAIAAEPVVIGGDE